MGKMPESCLAALKAARGRPRTIKKHHELIGENQRKEFEGRLSGVRVCRGLKFIKAYISGNIISPMQAIEGMCCECMGYYADVGSMTDCENPRCPLYYYMPYRKRT